MIIKKFNSDLNYSKMNENIITSDVHTLKERVLKSIDKSEKSKDKLFIEELESLLKKYGY